ncbi:DUF4387 domain-containing protein [Chitinasiproducens palmae]|uniref:DUF4387 domain-containing protein n=1 Tax=Chitinasiproducens palmae TaxID=1770053 RepID=A0A1H2PVZ2_9BURK|nr:DUF4387 domain-containing protein [Chitinasiproducens palmae]SDV51532.1 protein of unknown function [Chitinasiproducens palmae]
MPAIKDIASVCRSKNAGPFMVTLDIVFETDDLFDRVAATGVLTRERFATLYQVRPEQVQLTPYRAARAFKATLPRLVSSGDVGDTDVYGSQQHAPMLDLEIPIDMERAR